MSTRFEVRAEHAAATLLEDGEQLISVASVVMNDSPLWAFVGLLWLGLGPLAWLFLFATMGSKRRTALLTTRRVLLLRVEGKKVAKVEAFDRAQVRVRNFKHKSRRLKLTAPDNKSIVLDFEGRYGERAHIFAKAFNPI